jgi:serine protease Do
MRVIATAALALLFSAGAHAQENLWTDGRPDAVIDPASPMTFDAFSRLAAEAADSVVSIETEAAGAMSRVPFLFGPQQGGPEVRLGAGSGFVMNRDGHVLTNNHVVEGAQRITVHFKNGEERAAEVVGRDPATDIALLRVDPDGLALKPVYFGDSDALEIGEWVVAIGNPLGLAHTVTSGIVSAKGRREVRPDGDLLYANFIQTDASINPGNSGGPLFNLRGEVIGINTAISARGQGIGFAIPINMARTIVKQLAANGLVSRSWIGIEIQEVTPALAQSFGLERPRGALVARVVPGGPGGEAGLREGDIITAFNGKRIERHDDLPWLASTAGIGRDVPMQVMRDRRQRTVTVNLGRMPGQGDEVAADRRSKKGSAGTVALGITVEPVPARAAQQLGINGGALVARVDPGSPAARGGLRRGDVLLEVGGKSVKSVRDAVRRLSRIEQGDVVRVLVQRGERRRFIAFER